MRFGHGARQLKSRNRLFARHGGKAFERLVERIPGFEVVVQRFHRHTRPNKDRSAAQDLRIAVSPAHSRQMMQLGQLGVRNLRSRDWIEVNDQRSLASAR